MIYPADLINRALDLAGSKITIGDPQEGTREAQVALRLYMQTIEFLLLRNDWGFSRQAVALGAPIKTAPPGGYGTVAWTSAYPPIPWIYEYAYPANCLKIRSLRAAPVFIPSFLPLPNIFVEAYDDALADQVVLTNLAGAQAVITARVMDPNDWRSADFVEELVILLAKYLKPALGSEPAPAREKPA